MDGNGRWAKQKGLSRIAGHRAGVKPIRIVVKAAGEIGVKFLTLFAFSTENKNRPEREVQALFTLLKYFLRNEKKKLIKNNVQLKVIGDMAWFPKSVQREIEKTVDATSRNSIGKVHGGLTLILALNYGGRQDIVQACQRIIEDAGKHRITPPDIDEKTFSKYLYTKDFPDPDLLIRTSNESRISNFLLWQLSYAEIWITQVLWPDFTKEDFFDAIVSYQNRQRRFGKV